MHVELRKIADLQQTCPENQRKNHENSPQAVLVPTIEPYVFSLTQKMIGSFHKTVVIFRATKRR